MPFNDEGLARAIAACPIPVVTGIGHEPDTSIADMVADFRASTPTGAAEAVSPRKENLQQGFVNAANRIGRATSRTIGDCARAVDNLASRPSMRDAHNLFAQESMGLDALGMRMQLAIPQGLARDAAGIERASSSLQRIGSSFCDRPRAALDDARSRLMREGNALASNPSRELALAAARLNDLSPVAVLARGYSIARDAEGRIVKSALDIQPGDHLDVFVQDGSIPCTVDR